MTAYDVSRAELAQALEIAPCTLSEKLNCRSEWTSPEMWRVMSYLKIPDEEFHLYFSRGGEDVEEAAKMSANAYLRSVSKSAISDSSLETLCTLVEAMRTEAMAT